MKKLLFILIVSIIFISADENKYTIKGTADETLNGRTVYLYDLNTNERPKALDSAVVENGKFIIKGSFDSPSVLLLMLPTNREEDNKALSSCMATLLTENTDISVALSRPSEKYAQYETSIVSSNGLNGELGKMQKQIVEIEKAKYNATTKKQAEKIALTMKDLDIMEEQDSLRLVILNNVLEQNYDNILGVYCLMMIMSESDDLRLSQVKSMINKASLAHNFKPIMSQYELIKARETVSIGQAFVDFSVKEQDGTKGQFTDYISQKDSSMTLVHFGASWCGPCINALPQLKKIHEEFPMIKVIGVHLSDSEANFNKYIKEHSIKWTMLFSGESNSVLNLYGFDGIPSYLLIDSKGIIQHKGLMLPSFTKN